MIGDGTLVAGAPDRIAAALRGRSGPSPSTGTLSSRTGRADRCCCCCRRSSTAERLMALDYLGPVLACRRTALDPVSIRPASAEAAFRIAELFGPGAVGHLPQILSVRRAAGAEGRAPHGEVVRGHLDRTNRTEAQVAVAPDGLVQVLHPLPAPRPLASIIVPTRDRLDPAASLPRQPADLHRLARPRDPGLRQRQPRAGDPRLSARPGGGGRGPSCPVPVRSTSPP
ncbi:hypothetical protein ACU4GR_06680 [Methylobacterium oryzae CBMB20]